jgi:hypothetical protein
MSLVFANEGLVNVLNKLTAATGWANVRIKLYKNNYTPLHSSVLADFTEADFSGYTAVTPSYGSATLSGDTATTTDSSSRDFTHDSGGTTNTIYGYYVVDITDAKVLFAELFSSSQVMQNNGDKITITSLFTAKSEF